MHSTDKHFVLVRVQFYSGHMVLVADHHGNWRLPGGKVRRGYTPREQIREYLRTILDLYVESRDIIEVRGNVARGDSYHKSMLHAFRVNLGNDEYEHCQKVTKQNERMRIIPTCRASQYLSRSDLAAVF